jgi:hypothetical protein
VLKEVPKHYFASKKASEKKLKHNTLISRKRCIEL